MSRPHAIRDQSQQRVAVVAFSMGVAITLLATFLVVQHRGADATPGDTDTTFTPTAGCRLVDTRGPNNIGPRSKPLSANEVVEVQVHGDNGECTGDLAIPADATGIATNVTAVGATAASNLRIYPADIIDVPVLSNLNVTAGAPPTPNKVDVKLSPDGKIKVFNFRGSVHIIVDVVGWYGPKSLRQLALSVGTPGPQGPAGPQGEPGPADFDGFGVPWSTFVITPDIVGCPLGEVRVLVETVGAGMYFDEDASRCFVYDDVLRGGAEILLPAKSSGLPPLGSLYRRDPPQTLADPLDSRRNDVFIGPPNTDGTKLGSLNCGLSLESSPDFVCLFGVVTIGGPMDFDPVATQAVIDAGLHTVVGLYTLT